MCKPNKITFCFDHGAYCIGYQKRSSIQSSMYTHACDGIPIILNTRTYTYRIIHVHTRLVGQTSSYTHIHTLIQYRHQYTVELHMRTHRNNNNTSVCVRLCPCIERVLMRCHGYIKLIPQAAIIFMSLNIREISNSTQ